MILWFAGLAVLAVFVVFRDPAIDMRLVVAGALMPDVIDGPLGGARVLHSLAGGALLLAVVMLATVHRRGLRRRLLALPIGVLLHLVLDGIWARAETFWWPAFGWSLDGELPAADRPLGVLVVQELVGAAVLWWCWVRFGLADRQRRRALLRDGRLGRDTVS